MSHCAVAAHVNGLVRSAILSKHAKAETSRRFPNVTPVSGYNPFDAPPEDK